MDLPAIGQIHDQYLALSRMAGEGLAGGLSGKLLLRNGLDAEGIGVLIAASVAGAASLCVDADGELLRKGLRGGLCDFVVSSLDESVRILKNEIRRGRAVSVCLEAKPEKCLAELAERGVQPDLLSPGSLRGSAPMEIFAERGSVVLAAETRPAAERPLLQWTAGAEGARGMAQMARIAAESLEEGLADTAVRRHWLRSSPRSLGRTLGAQQCVRMTAEESAHFLGRVSVEVPTASVTRDGTTTALAGGQGIFSSRGES